MATLTTMLAPEKLEVLMASEKFLLIYTLGQILFACLISPLLAGLIKMAYCAERDEEFHVSTIFEYYNAPYFKELFIATLLISLFGSGLVTACNYAGVELLGLLITATISFFTIMTIPLIIFGELKAIDAISSSFVIVLKQPLVLFGLIFVSYLASMVGFIGCCIGIFFTLPFTYSMYYAMYSEIIGFDDDELSV